VADEIDALLAALIAEHASHGFAGCRVYVAAVALQDALAGRLTPPGESATQDGAP